VAKLVVVENDKVEGTDKHNVSGLMAAGTPPPAYSGVGDFDYVGKMTGALSDFVSIDGQPAALISSQSSLDPGEDIPFVGRHSGPMGSNFVPPGENPATLVIQDPIGTGDPNAAAGSSFVQVGGDALLLDGDAIDTCDGLGVPANSTVTVENQDFVSCSE
jgi:hypothetical protein